MKPTNQKPQPTVRDWTKPQVVRISQLAQTISEANAAGYWSHWMRFSPEVNFEICFSKLKPTTTNKR